MATGKMRRGTSSSAISKAKKTQTLRASRPGKKIVPYRWLGDVPEVEVYIPGFGELKLKNRGNGMFEMPGENLRTRYLPSKPAEVTNADWERLQVDSIYAHFYLSEADGLKALTVTQALITYLADLGYGAVKILEVEQGSLWGRFKAAWNSEYGEVTKQKGGEAYQYAEQWAKDAFVNKQMAEVTATNVSSIATLLESTADQQDAIIHVGNLLVIKQAGKPMVKQLSVPEMYALQTHSGILKDPSRAVEMLALAVAGGPQQPSVMQ